MAPEICLILARALGILPLEPSTRGTNPPRNIPVFQCTVQKGQNLHLVSLIQRASILYVTETKSVASFLWIFTRYLSLYRAGLKGICWNVP
jgi:hypothetical protein